MVNNNTYNYLLSDLKKLNQTDKENLKLDPDVFEDLAEKIIL